MEHPSLPGAGSSPLGSEFSLPGYEVADLLGFGATGEVWRAIEISTGETVALKRLHGSFEPLLAAPGVAGSPGLAGVAGLAELPLSVAAEDLRREAALLSSVHHEHVVQLRSVVPTSGGLVLVLDYADGGSLAALLAVRGRLSGGEVVTIGAPLAQALSDVHAQGLLHGDITPANVLFTAEGKPLLADLGVGSLAAERAEVKGVTPGFADPGAAAASSPATRSFDVYGLAATCYAALAGRAPGGHVVPAGPAAEGGAVIAGPAPGGGVPRPHTPLAALAPTAPASLVAAIESALVADARLRPDAAAFSRALFGACSPEPVRLVAGGAVLVPDPAPTNRISPRAAATVAAPADAGRPARATRRRVRDAGRAGLVGRVGRAGQAGRAARAAAGRRTVRRLAFALAGAALVGGAIVAGVVWASHSSRVKAIADEQSAAVGSAPSVIPSAPAVVGVSPQVAAGATSGPAVATTDWTAVLGLLDSRRDQAFMDADAAELDAVYTAGSADLVADRATLARLVAAGEHASGLALRLVSVAVVPAERASDSSVTLTVDDVLPTYEIVASTGQSVAMPGRAKLSWTVVLAAGPAGEWRIAAVSPAPGLVRTITR